MTGRQIASLLVQLLLLIGIVWLARRGLLFLRNLLRPVRDPVRRVLAPLEERAVDHVEASLRSAGLDPLANGARNLVDRAHQIEQGVGDHLDRLEADIKAKRERRDPTL